MSYEEIRLTETLKNYKQALIALIRYAGNKSLDKLTKPEYQKYLLFLTEKKRYSAATLNVHINGWKFYQEKVLERNKEFYDVAYPRMSSKLPTVYSTAIFDATTSLKYRTLFRIVYGTGLRLSEIAHLKIADIDCTRRLINVRGGKDKKDRIVMLTDTIEIDISEYLTYHNPRIYLFENLKHGDPIANRTIQSVYSQSVYAARIQKRGGIHSLRHSFLTHLLETGTNIRHIQALLGYESIMTPIRYTHVTANKISTLKSPLDDL